MKQHPLRMSTRRGPYILTGTQDAAAKAAKGLTRAILDIEDALAVLDSSYAATNPRVAGLRDAVAAQRRKLLALKADAEAIVHGDDAGRRPR